MTEGNRSAAAGQSHCTVQGKMKVSFSKMLTGGDMSGMFTSFQGASMIPTDISTQRVHTRYRDPCEPVLPEY